MPAKGHLISALLSAISRVSGYNHAEESTRRPPCRRSSRCAHTPRCGIHRCPLARSQLHAIRADALASAAATSGVQRAHWADVAARVDAILDPAARARPAAR